ncbi:cyclic nucleotide-binding domain-containing protein 2-like [Lissotriton helveticus]
MTSLFYFDAETSSRKRYEKIMVNSHCVLDPIYQRAPLNHLPARLLEQQDEEPKFTLPPIMTEADKHLHEQKRVRERVREAALAERQSMMLSTPYGRIHKGFNAAVYLRIDELQVGDCMGLHQYLLPHRLQDKRRLVLVSKGTEIIKLKKERFDELADGATIAIVRKMEHTYPSDDELCQTFLKQNCWKLFKRDLVNTLLDRQVIKPKRDLKTGDHSFIQFSIDLNQDGMLNLVSVVQAHQESELHQEPMFIPIDRKGKISADGLPGIEMRLIHGINIPRNRLDKFLQ